MGSENDKGGLNPDRPMWDATCSGCGNPCKVPFEPQEGRPVYCRDCFKKNRRR